MNNEELVDRVQAFVHSITIKSDTACVAWTDFDDLCQRVYDEMKFLVLDPVGEISEPGLWLLRPWLKPK